MFVKSVHDKRLIDCLYIADYGEPVALAYDRRFMLVALDELIRIDANYQVIAALLRVIQKVQMSYVEHVIDALGVSHAVMFFRHCHAPMRFRNLSRL